MFWERFDDVMAADLPTAIEEAQLLLAYAARQGMDLDRDVVNTIMGAEQFHQTDQWTPELETDFWLAFNAIARAVQPVSVMSLKAASDMSGIRPLTAVIFRQKYKISRARAAVNRYKNLAFFFLFLLLLTNIYWIVGSSIISDINDSNTLIDELNIKISEQIKVAGENAADDPELMKLEAQLETTVNQTYANLEFLKRWNNWWQAFLILPQKVLVWHAKIYDRTNEPRSSDPNDTRYKMSEIILTQKSAHFVSDAIQSFLLPLLYGLLGATAYVLRMLSHEVENLTYSRTSDIRYQLRIVLGALAGLAIGWFIEPENAATFSWLSSLALAFVAGYSVEVLFAAMDRFISAFSQENPNPSPKTTDKSAE